jgi:hypothetical protein
MMEPWYLVSILDPTLDRVWTYGQRFCCEQLFCDQKSGIFQRRQLRCGTVGFGHGSSG